MSERGGRRWGSAVAWAALTSVVGCQALFGVDLPGQDERGGGSAGGAGSGGAAAGTGQPPGRPGGPSAAAQGEPSSPRRGGARGPKSAVRT